MSTLNPAVDMAKPQGLSKVMAYEARVVQNDDRLHEDKRMLGRIQIRVDSIFTGIKDEMLPWAIPEFGSQCDGASGNSGFFMVPKIGSKVLVYFQDGSPLHPKYSAYTVDEKTALKEREHNYPNRVIHLFQNSCMLIVDTKSNEVFFRDPGDLNIYVLGNVNLKVNGNVLEKIDGSRTTQIKGNVVEVVDGNKTLYLKGNYNETIKGTHSQYVDGAFLEKCGSNRDLFVGSTNAEAVGGSRTVTVGGSDMHSVSGNIVRSGARIDDNPPGGGAPGGSAPSTPGAPTIKALPNWPVVRGMKPDTDEKEPKEKY